MRSRIGRRDSLAWVMPLIALIAALALPACNESSGTNPASADGTADEAYLATADWVAGEELAGPPQPGRPSFDPLRERDALELTEDQIAEIEALREELRESMEALRDQLRNGEIDRETFRSEERALLEAQREGLAAILTEEQLAQLESMQSENALRHFAERLERIGESDVAERVARMTELLGLDDTQVAALTQILESATTNETAILQAAIAGETSVEETHEALRILRDSTRDATQEILTDEQIRILEEAGLPPGAPGRPGEAEGPNGRGGPRFGDPAGNERSAAF